MQLLPLDDVFYGVNTKLMFSKHNILFFLSIVRRKFFLGFCQSPEYCGRQLLADRLFSVPKRSRNAGTSPAPFNGSENNFPASSVPLVRHTTLNHLDKRYKTSKHTSAFTLSPVYLQLFLPFLPHTFWDVDPPLSSGYRAEPVSSLQAPSFPLTLTSQHGRGKN